MIDQPMSPDTPAWQLVIESLKPDPDPARLASLAAARPAVDELLAICRDHGVLLIVNRALQWTLRDLLDEAGLESWRAAVASCTMASLTLSRELPRLLPLLSEAGVTVTPFKGPSLAERLFGDPALRMSCDLDLLVPPGQVAAALEVLDREGYRQNFRPTQLQRWLRPGSQVNHCTLQHRTGQWLVELHWALFAAWRRTNQPVMAHAPSIADDAVEMLMYLCLHGAHHWWLQLKWIVDVDRWVRASVPFDWEELFARARERGCVRVVCLGLFLARQICGLELPESVAEAIRDDQRVAGLAGRVARLWPPPLDRQPALLWKLSYQLACRERLADRLGMLIDYPLARRLPF